MNLFPPPRRIRFFPGTVSRAARCREITDPALPPDGFRLQIAPDEIRIAGSSPSGVFYGKRMLNKICRQHAGMLPAMEIEDQPDFPLRGLLLAGAANPETLHALIPRLADGGINQLQIKIRENFLLKKHERICRKAGVVWTPEILRDLDRVCREHFIELVPFLNSCGHFEPFLEDPAYRDLALYPAGGFTFPWGDTAETGTMLNMKQESLDFLFGIYEEILPCFSSGLVNIGCDETWELGSGYGEYCMFINRIARWLRQKGKRCQIWGDILLQSPEHIRLLDPDITVLVWGYNDGYPFERNLRYFHDAGIRTVACPGTSAYLSICGRTGTARRNIEDAAAAAHAAGSEGILNTDWQFMFRPWCTAYLPIAHGAAAAWNSGGALHAENMAGEADELFFDGREPALCCWIERFGRLSDILGTEIVVEDRSTLFCLYEHRFTPESLRSYGIDRQVMRRFRKELERLRSDLKSLPVSSSAGADARQELRHALDLAELGGCFAERLLGMETPAFDRLAGKVIHDHAASWNRFHPEILLPGVLQNLRRMINAYRDPGRDAV